jgi:hypothetical protein
MAACERSVQAFSSTGLTYENGQHGCMMAVMLLIQICSNLTAAGC